MIKTITLVYPRPGDQKIISGIPHSIMALEQPLTEAGFSVNLFDEKTEIPYEQMFRESDVIGFSVMTGPQIEYALTLTQKARELNPEALIIWGGWHPTLLPEETIEEPMIDYVIMGEGEERLVSLLHALNSGEDLSEIHGLAYKKGNTSVVTQYQPSLRQSCHFIDYTRFDLSPYIQNKTADIISSFGCPFRCAFCSQNSIYGRAWKGQGPQELYETVAHIHHTYKVEEFEFVDTNFFVSPHRVIEFAEILISHNLKIKWGASVRADQLAKIPPEFFETICKSGFSTAAIGFESASEHVLGIIMKDEPLEDYYKAIERCKKYNIRLFATFITGIPGESSQDYSKTRSFIAELKKSYSSARVALLYYTPYPGTKLYEQALEHGFIPPKGLCEWGKFSHNNVNIPWLSDEIKKKADYDIMKLHAADPSERIIKDKTIYIYGAALSGDIAYDMLIQAHKHPDYFIETHPSKNIHRNLPVISFEELKTKNPEQIVIASYGYQDEIAEMLDAEFPGCVVILLYPNRVFYI